MLKKFLLIVVVGVMMSVSCGRAMGMNWPPQPGEPFPDLALIDQTGQSVKISDFKGSVILVEFIGMTCPACQAFVGAHRVGAYQGIVPQSDLQSIEEYFPRYTGGMSLSDERIVYIQILLYDMSMEAPTEEDARAWADHFHMDRSKNRIVLAGEESLLSDATYNLIPGFQLLDKKLIIRSDSTGHNPRHNLYTHLLPLVPQLIKEAP